MTEQKMTPEIPSVEIDDIPSSPFELLLRLIDAQKEIRRLNDYIAATKDRTLPELPEGFVIINMHNNTVDGHWYCHLRYTNGCNIYAEGRGLTPRAAMEAAIAEIKEGEP